MGFRAQLASSLLVTMQFWAYPAAASERSPLLGTFWEIAADRVTEATGQQIEASMLYAIALIESGHDKGDRAVAPWPLAINIAGKAHYPKSRADAVNLLETAGNKADVGLGQISLRWHGERVSSPADLLDPRTNIRIVADILIESFRADQNDLELNIGRYHSYNETRARAYGRRVLALTNRLEDLWGPQ